MSVQIIEEANRKIAVIQNEKLEVWISSLGATILKLFVKDKNGKKQNVVLAYKDQKDNEEYKGYLGASVGRVANRIQKGHFVLNGKEYQLDINNGPNTLHGGIEGFSFQNFHIAASKNKDEAIFYLLSLDGDQNFPGNMMIQIGFAIKSDRLILHYQAMSDEDTLCNLTNHTYFNLSGKPEYIGKHLLQMDSDYYACSDGDGLVTGEIAACKNTPFDFTEFKKIDEALKQEDYEQIQKGSGIDHPFLFKHAGTVSQVLEGSAPVQVQLKNEETGLRLSISSSLPQAQVYSGNFLSGEKDLENRPMPKRSGICFETQYMPDDINLNPDSKTILRKGEAYDEATSYQFTVYEES
jgi:aldose 1-epimerase